MHDLWHLNYRYIFYQQLNKASLIASGSAMMQLMWYSIYRRNRKIREVNTRVCGHREGFKNSLLAFPYHYFRQSDQSNPSVIVRILERRVWRYQGGNQNPYIEEQTTQWSKEKVQKDNQRSTKHTYKAKDRVTRTPLKTGGELRCSGRASSSCSTSDTRRVNLVTNPVIQKAKCFVPIQLFILNHWQSGVIAAGVTSLYHFC